MNKLNEQAAKNTFSSAKKNEASPSYFEGELFLNAFPEGELILMKAVTITEIENMIKEKEISYTVIEDTDFNKTNIKKGKKTLAIHFDDNGIATGYTLYE